MNRKILIIEDDSSIRRVLAVFLESEGYEVITASDGAAGLEKLVQNTGIAAILLDLRMPGMDGYTFRTIQQENPKIASIPVLVVSADNETARFGKSLGAVGTIKKPFDPDDLLRALDSVFPKESPVIPLKFLPAI